MRQLYHTPSLKGHHRRGTIVRARGWAGSMCTVASKHVRPTALMNSQQLWLLWSANEHFNIEGKGFRSPNLSWGTTDLWCPLREVKSVFKGVVPGRWTMIQPMAPHHWVYKQHRMDSGCYKLKTKKQRHKAGRGKMNLEGLGEAVGVNMIKIYSMHVWNFQIISKNIILKTDPNLETGEW